MPADQSGLRFIWFPHIKANCFFDERTIRRLLLMGDEVLFLEDPRSFKSATGHKDDNFFMEFDTCLREKTFQVLDSETVEDMVADDVLCDETESALSDASNLSKVVTALHMRPGSYNPGATIGKDFELPPLGYMNFSQDTTGTFGHVDLSWLPSSKWLPWQLSDFAQQLSKELPEEEVSSELSNILQLKYLNSPHAGLTISDLRSAYSQLADKPITHTRAAVKAYFPSAMVAMTACMKIADQLDAHILPTPDCGDALSVVNAYIHGNSADRNLSEIGLELAYELLLERLDISSALDKLPIEAVLEKREKLSKSRKKFLCLAKELRAELNRRPESSIDVRAAVEDFFATKMEPTLSDYMDSTRTKFCLFHKHFGENLISSQSLWVAALSGFSASLSQSLATKAPVMMILGGLVAAAGKSLVKSAKTANDWPELVKVFNKKTKGSP